ncbi:hypothetical protein [Vulgatibacter sp.]|uniref:hypothetical protein n=1 Tax=Vulgatibacter sp. TaxID=1971226 RepID=UPI003566CCDE
MAEFSAEAVAAALGERWEEYLQAGESFEAAIDTEGTEARVSITLVDADGATRHEFEVKAPQRVGGAGGSVEVAMDAADALVGQWLEEGRPRLPGVAAAREYEGTPVVVTMRLVHPRLQAEADRLLGDEGDDEGGLDA